MSEFCSILQVLGKESNGEEPMKCGKCKDGHGSVAAVKACYAGATVSACTWLVERWFHSGDPDDGGYQAVVDCGAEAIFTDRGFECAAGHSHVVAEVRSAEGWDYAEDHGEAEILAKWGTEPRDLATGGAFRW